MYICTVLCLEYPSFASFRGRSFFFFYLDELSRAVGRVMDASVAVVDLSIFGAFLSLPVDELQLGSDG